MRHTTNATLVITTEARRDQRAGGRGTALVQRQHGHASTGGPQLPIHVAFTLAAPTKVQILLQVTFASMSTSTSPSSRAPACRLRDHPDSTARDNPAVNGRDHSFPLSPALSRSPNIGRSATSWRSSGRRRRQNADEKRKARSGNEKETFQRGHSLQCRPPPQVRHKAQNTTAGGRPQNTTLLPGTSLQRAWHHGAKRRGLYQPSCTP